MPLSRSRLLLAIAASALVAGCGSSESESGEWTRADIDDVVAIDCCGSPLEEGKAKYGVLAIDSHGVVQVVLANRIVAVADRPALKDEQVASFAAGPDVAASSFTTESGQVWLVTSYGSPPLEQLKSPDPDLTDAIPLFDGEGDYRIVGSVHGRVHVWSDGEEEPWSGVDSGTAPRAGKRPLLASAEEVMTRVVTHTAKGPHLWTTAGDIYDAGPWIEMPLPGRPDSVTDVTSWEVGTWLAGHRGTKPLLWDYDGDLTPVLLTAPTTRLDPEDPRVLLGDDYAGRVVATQSAKGPIVWIRAENGTTWKRWDAPKGTITAVRVVEDRLHVVVDGALWTRTIPAL